MLPRSSRLSSFSSLKTLVQKIGNYYCGQVCRREFLTQQFQGFNERAVEYRFLFENLAQVCPKSLLDVGTGKTALPQLIRTFGPLVTAIDNVKDYWPKGMMNRHYHVVGNDILAPTIEGPFDFITCISTLEHIRDHQRAMRNMFSLLAPGGHMVITFPYTEREYVENVYALPGSIGATTYSFPTQSFSRRELDSWVRDNNGRILTQEYWRFFSGPYWTLGSRVVPPVKVSESESHQLSCVLLEKVGSTTDSLA